jgi:hypothetical protein
LTGGENGEAMIDRIICPPAGKRDSSGLGR